MGTWAKPEHSRSAVDRAARTVACSPADAPQIQSALAIVNNWRSAHAFPLNTIQVNLRARARAVDPDAIVAQRIKRMPSIVGKVQRFPEMKLSRMQDIGGCRAVLNDIESVRRVHERYLEGNGRHVLERQDDYIDVSPKPSGYRGIHLVYRYNSKRTETYNGLRIEMQIRSRIQHAWATAVETVGFFTEQALKSSQGAEDWLRFFALMGSETASIEEAPIVPGTPASASERREEIRALAQRLDVARKLSAYGHTLKQTEADAESGARYHILELNASSGRLVIISFDRLADATTVYEERETLGRDTGVDVVLVSVDSLSSLRRAYPNYFLDTAYFRQLVAQAIRQ